MHIPSANREGTDNYTLSDTYCKLQLCLPAFAGSEVEQMEQPKPLASGKFNARLHQYFAHAATESHQLVSVLTSYMTLPSEQKYAAKDMFVNPPIHAPQCICRQCHTRLSACTHML